MVAPQFVLAECIVAIKSSLTSGYPVVALACKRCSKQYSNFGENAKWRHTIDLYAGCGHKWDLASQVQNSHSAALRWQLRDDGLWVYKVPVCDTKGEC